MKKNIKIKKLDQAPSELLKQINDLEKVLFAKASPELLKQLSQMMNRNVVDKKDTEDYNFDVISGVLDQTIKPFIDAGQDGYNPGDLVSIDSKYSKKEDIKKEFEESKKTGEYESFPFSNKIEADIRGKFILRTNKSDNYKDLIQELKSNLISNKIITKEELETLLQAIKLAEPRIFAENLMFVEPYKENKSSVVMSIFEKIRFNLNKQAKYINKKDNHDLLTLKELVNMAKQNEVDPLTIGPGFFTKYMPELKTLGYEGIVVKIKNKKLVEIKLSKLPPHKRMVYSPTESAIHLVNYFTNFTHNAFEQNGKKLYFTTNKINFKMDKDEQYYVVVDGTVAGPAQKTPYNYEEFSYNNKRIKAAEVFLFENNNSQIIQTRVYFYPYKPNDVHILHQHGSIIMGSNDQMYHSCYKEEFKDAAFADSVVKRYKMWWKKRQEKESFSSAVIAERLHGIIFGKSQPEAISTDLLRIENYDNLKNVVQSVSEVNEFSIQETLYELPFVSSFFNGEFLKYVEKCTKNYAPMSHRWLLKKYISDGKGLTLETQPTYYVQLAKKVKANSDMNWFKEYSKLQQLKNKVASGEDSIEAYNEIYKKAS